MTKRVAIVTGAGRGIGAATARKLAEEKFDLILVSRTEKQLQEVRRNILEDFSETEILCIPADVCNEEQMKAVFEECREHFGKLDLLINNAGYIKVSALENNSLEDWHKTLDVNLTALFLSCREAISIMEAGACIINISSLAGVSGVSKFPGFVPYSAAKAGVIGFSEALAVELAGNKIRVQVLAPGAVDTQMLREALPNVKTSTQPKQIAEEIWRLYKDEGTGKLKVLSN